MATRAGGTRISFASVHIHLGGLSPELAITFTGTPARPPRRQGEHPHVQAQPVKKLNKKTAQSHTTSVHFRPCHVMRERMGDGHQGGGHAYLVCFCAHPPRVVRLWERASRPGPPAAGRPAAAAPPLLTCGRPRVGTIPAPCMAPES